MNIKHVVNEITTRPMDRREFLRNAGAVGLSVIGVSALLKTLGGTRGGGSSQGGYGSSSYGGRKAGR